MEKAVFVQEGVVSMQVIDVLSCYFGTSFGTTKVTFGGLDVFTRANPLSSVTMADIGAVLSTKVDRIENTRLAKG